MSRFWPHPPYSEDQPFPHAILATHVLTRGVQTGALLGSGLGASIFFLRHFRLLKPRIPPSAFTSTVVRSSGVGAGVGVALLAVMLEGRMWGREKIEWQDRSWRLLENRGQVECDDWSYGGALLGVGSAVRGGNSGWRGAVGKVGLGSLVGMVGYMGWRYGVKGGKWEEEERKL